MSSSAIANVLARAKAAELRSTVETADDNGGWPAGAGVELDIAGVVTRGRVAFVEDGWVYWGDDAGAVHATPAQHLRRSA
jgi:hypothetical protein